MWIEIFKTGKHTDAAGNRREWTEDDLEKIASSYDPKAHEAPVVIGHPRDNAPAFGWVEGVKREGGTLLAKLKDLVPEFVEMVKKGLFKKRSIALYPDLTLRHVGFLGANPPAVKGLADIKFGEKEAMEIEFLEGYQQETIRSVLRRLREWLIEKFGLEEADKVVSTWDVDNLEPKTETNPAPAFSAENEGGNGMKEFLEKLKALITGAEKDLNPAAGASFSEAEMKAREEAAAQTAREAAAREFAEREKQKEAELKRREEALLAKEAEARRGEIVAFVEGLKREGKIVPAMEKIGAGITNFMVEISASPTLLEFKEGEETKKQTPIEFMKSFLSGLPRIVEFGEVATRDKDAGGTGSAGEKLQELTRKKMADQKLSYGAAFAEVQKENPDLTREFVSELASYRTTK